jgi:hypothetical protein
MLLQFWKQSRAVAGMMSATPYLYYQDLAGALKVLAKAFGFWKYGVQMRRLDGKINHAAMTNLPGRKPQTDRINLRILRLKFQIQAHCCERISIRTCTLLRTTAKRLI